MTPRMEDVEFRGGSGRQMYKVARVLDTVQRQKAFHSPLLRMGCEVMRARRINLCDSLQACIVFAS